MISIHLQINSNIWFYDILYDGKDQLLTLVHVNCKFYLLQVMQHIFTHIIRKSRIRKCVYVHQISYHNMYCITVMYYLWMQWRSFYLVLCVHFIKHLSIRWWELSRYIMSEGRRCSLFKIVIKRFWNYHRFTVNLVSHWFF